MELYNSAQESDAKESSEDGEDGGGRIRRKTDRSVAGDGRERARSGRVTYDGDQVRAGEGEKGWGGMGTG